MGQISLWSMRDMLVLLIVVAGISLTSSQIVQSELTRKIHEMERFYQQKIKELSQKVQNMNTNPPWPLGSYCILQSGNCPPGFKPIYGHMLAMSVYSGSNAYIRQAQFGNSRIGCHAGCTSRKDHWLGDLVLSTCCK